MVTKGTTKPYIQFLGNSATDVTGSMHHIRFQKYSILLDCGLIQGHDIATDYRMNREQVKKVKPNQIDYIILSHCHVDHSSLIPAMFAKGCHGHVYVPQGSTPFLKLLWHDSMRIMQSDCEKLVKKHGMKASPLYGEKDIEMALERCIEVPYNQPKQIGSNIWLEYYPSGHIIHAAQVYLELQEGYTTKRIGFTGDIAGPTHRPYTTPRQTLPFVDVLIGESTYNAKSRINNARDRDNDIAKIKTVVDEAHRVLIPTFSLQRTQELLKVLYDMWGSGELPDFPIYLDSPLAQKICNIWCDHRFDHDILGWKNLKFIHEYPQSVALQNSDEKCIILSASGFLNGGRVIGHLKTVLPKSNATILFVGYSGENNLASQIKMGQKEVLVDGQLVRNNAKIVDLRSFSSHASREELMDYYADMCRYNKLCLVHGEFEGKVEFAHELQDDLVAQGNSARVIAVNQDTKIYI